MNAEAMILPSLCFTGQRGLDHEQMLSFFTLWPFHRVGKGEARSH